ncbi:MAG: hypothetical protein Q9221_003408 [Calogaya cf. arnoldii]
MATARKHLVTALPSAQLTIAPIRSAHHELIIRQQPDRAKVADKPDDKGLRNRKPIDPPPIVQLRLHDPLDPAE